MQLKVLPWFDPGQKKRDLPGLLTAMKQFKGMDIPWLSDYSLIIEAASNT